MGTSRQAAGEDGAGGPAAAPSPRGAYALAEGLHLRQWLLRAVVPLAVLATNGAGWVRIASLPAQDAPLRWAGVEPGEARASIAAALLATGVALVGVSVLLRALAKSVLVRKTTVTTAGVYRWVRHPYYLAILLGGAGVLLLAGPLGAVVALLWLAVALPVFLATMAGEERGLRALHGARWDDYAGRVPGIVPRLTPARTVGPSADEGRPPAWGNLVREGEPPRALRFVAGALVVAGVRCGGERGAALVSLAAVLWAGSFVLQRALKPA